MVWHDQTNGEGSRVSEGSGVVLSKEQWYTEYSYDWHRLEIRRKQHERNGRACTQVMRNNTMGPKADPRPWKLSYMRETGDTAFHPLSGIPEEYLK